MSYSVEEMLYRCILELSYVQSVPAEMAASGEGEQCVEEGLKLLGICCFHDRGLADARRAFPLGMKPEDLKRAIAKEDANGNL